MSETLFTGERLEPGSRLFGVDLARHRAAYSFALRAMEAPRERLPREGASDEAAPSARVLDLGCGNGYGTAEIADAHFEAAGRLGGVVGVDRVAPAAASRRPGASFLRADLRGIPLASGSFDWIVSFQVIEHLEDPTRYLEAIARLLAPGGTALITTPNVLTSDGVNPYHLHEYEADELRGVLARHFEAVDMQGVRAGPRVADYFEGRLRRIRRIMRLDPLGLRDRLPRGLVEWLFARFALLVRRGIAQDEGLPEAGIEDFPIGPADPGDLDLLAVCSRPGR